MEGRADHGAASAGKQHIGPPPAPGRPGRRIAPCHHFLRQRGPHGRRPLRRRRHGVPGGGGAALPAMPPVPQGDGGHPPGRADGAGPRPPGAAGGPAAKPAAGRLYPAQRRGRQGVYLPGLRRPEPAGPERAAEAGGGGPALCGLPVLRGDGGGAAAHHPLPLCGVEAPGRGRGRPGRHRPGPVPGLCQRTAAAGEPIPSGAGEQAPEAGAAAAAAGGRMARRRRGPAGRLWKAGPGGYPRGGGAAPGPYRPAAPGPDGADEALLPGVPL